MVQTHGGAGSPGHSLHVFRHHPLARGKVWSKTLHNVVIWRFFYVKSRVITYKKARKTRQMTAVFKEPLFSKMYFIFSPPSLNILPWKFGVFQYNQKVEQILRIEMLLGMWYLVSFLNHFLDCKCCFSLFLTFKKTSWNRNVEYHRIVDWFWPNFQVAKLADSGVKDKAETTSTLAESNNDYDENVAVTVHSSSGNIQISAKNITSKII